MATCMGKGATGSSKTSAAEEGARSLAAGLVALSRVKSSAAAAPATACGDQFGVVKISSALSRKADTSRSLSSGWPPRVHSNAPTGETPSLRAATSTSALSDFCLTASSRQTVSVGSRTFHCPCGGGATGCWNAGRPVAAQLMKLFLCLPSGELKPGPLQTPPLEGENSKITETRCGTTVELSSVRG